MPFLRALVLCTAGALLIGLGVAAKARTPDAGAIETIHVFPVAIDEWAPDMAGGFHVPGAQAFIVRLPNG